MTSEETSNVDVNEMWNKSCFLIRLVASSVRVAETAGSVIKTITNSADLKIVDKGTDGKKDLQTEADRSAQFVIDNSLQKKFNGKLKVIGEEEKTSEVPTVELNVSTEVLQLDSKCPPELREATEKDVVIWVDPLDGTSEFAEAAKTKSPLLEQVTVLIGIAYKGRSVAGVIHQPFYGENGRTVWGIDGIGTFGANLKQKGDERVVVTTRSHNTTLVQTALDSLEEQKLLDARERIGGAGYKVLKCLESAAAYVFASGGCKKWDTAGPEAVIRAAGGELTDISGRRLYYGADAQRQNTGGVLATACWVKHEDYVNAIPDEVKKMLPEIMSKS
ncbi:hypothetical protein M3Y94_01177000 [Aphelenchoides besseyi]|nr:hypothetical protein M3Y94_01177000 [Aphelenchoides besseyi]KAI6228206.1 hypothetical protein M3Y95_00598200 [Aphelenchoides besseyi]